MVHFVQKLIPISDIFIGVSVLGIANALADMFVNASLAKKGFEIMAVTGIITGQMYNFLFSLALFFIQKFFNPKIKTKFHLFDGFDLIGISDQIMTLVIVGSSALMLFFIIVKVQINK